MFLGLIWHCAFWKKTLPSIQKSNITNNFLFMLFFQYPPLPKSPFLAASWWSSAAWQWRPPSLWSTPPPPSPWHGGRIPISAAGGRCPPAGDGEQTGTRTGPPSEEEHNKDNTLLWGFAKNLWVIFPQKFPIPTPSLSHELSCPPSVPTCGFRPPQTKVVLPRFYLWPLQQIPYSLSSRPT